MTTTTKPSSKGSATSASKGNRDWSKEGGLLHAEPAANGKPTSRGFFELKEVSSSKDSRVNLEPANGTHTNETSLV